MTTRALQILAGLLFLIAAANAGQQSLSIYKTFHDLFLEEDSVSHADKVYAPVRANLQELGATRMGYRLPAGVTFAQKAGDFYVIQYSLAPLLIRPLKTDDEWVLMDYSRDRVFPTPDLSCIRDFENGLAIHIKRAGSSPSAVMDLGKVWHEQEGVWKGTWVRRGLTNTFDARYSTSDGQEVHDEITYESNDCNTVVLFRKGTKGRYRGQLSADGTRIENGRGDWFSINDRWSATIEKAQ